MTPLPAPTPDVKHLAEIIGPEATLALVEARGGTRMYVPENAERATDLNELIGKEAAKKLIDAHGRNQIKVPIGRTWRILVYRAAGMSYSAIARKAGCTEGSVWHTLSRHAMTTRQLDLFG